MNAIRKLARDRRGVAMVEFALALPIFVPIAMYSVEMSNFALTQLKISQSTLNLADNASRVGVDTGLSTVELREVDLNDVFQGARLQAGRLDITTNGRITVSSLEQNAAGGQIIHWQRCVGLKSGVGYDSSYGAEGAGTVAGDGFVGMGDAGSMVTAPPNSAVIFVEINYEYKPLITTYFLGNTHLHSIASMIVRDKRDLSKGVTDPSPGATHMTCNLHTR